jgi:capsular polysaccharide transport system permease protein
VTRREEETMENSLPVEPLTKGCEMTDLSAETGALSAPVGPHPFFRLRPLGARNARWRLARMSFLVLVALPTVVAAIYYFLIAANQYVVEFRFAVRSVEPLRDNAPALLRSSVATAQLGLDSNIVVQYLRSRALVERLDKRFDLEKIFSRKEADWVSRIHPPVPIERLVQYWNGQVDAFFDVSDGTVTVKLRTFRPADALTLARAALLSSERLVNRLSLNARRAAMEQSKREVARAEHGLGEALRRLEKFREAEGLINPQQTADRTLALVAEVKKEILGDEARLAALKSYISASTPSVHMLQTRIAALTSEERALEARLTAAREKSAPALSRLMGGYAELESERRFAETAYRHALAALDRSRAEADRRQIYLATFVPPSLPEEPLYPHRLRAVGTVFVIAFALWAIGGLFFQSVRDHF